MNVDDLKLGDIKKLMCLFSKKENESSQLLDSAIGKYCIVRSRNEGINCGLIVAADDTGCIIDEARRVYYHKPKDSNTSWYEGVSVSGLSSDSKISCVTKRKYIIEKYSLTQCSVEAEKSLRSHEAQKS